MATTTMQQPTGASAIHLQTGPRGRLQPMDAVTGGPVSPGIPLVRNVTTDDDMGSTEVMSCVCVCV